MAAAETPAETFKRALAHAARALAEQSELEVVFGSDGPKLSNGVLTLPHPPRDPGGPESATLLGQADRTAASVDLLDLALTPHPALDEPTLARIAGLLQPQSLPDASHAALVITPWQATVLEAITFCASQVSATGFSPELRLRMSESARAQQLRREREREKE